MFDFVPDTHGQRELLDALVTSLGYRRSPAGWRRPDPDRRLVFLGDYVDRGPDAPGVVRRVRELVDADAALAIAGNHEINMIRFHAEKLGADMPMRPHTEKNISQHAATLSGYAGQDDRLIEDLRWMADLPLWLDLGDVRAVHAAWNEAAVRRLFDAAPGGRIGIDGHLRFDKTTEVGADIEFLTCGPEVDLPPPHAFHDKGGHPRTSVRIAWWRSDATSLQEMAVSVPNLSEIPDGPLPDSVADLRYPGEAPPVLFGHYWKSWNESLGPLEAPNALCLDFSAGLGGPLVGYRHEQGAPLDPARCIVQNR